MKVTIDSYAWVDKADLPTLSLQIIKKALTIKPKKVGSFPGPPPNRIYLYKETPTHIGIAREYYSKFRRAEHEVTYKLNNSSLSSDLKFNGVLRPEQQEALEKIVQCVNEGKTGGIVKASPGWGKTSCSCAIISELKMPTLVVVHKEFLMHQWVERINQFLPGASIGFVQGDICDFVGKDIVIGMVQSLSQREYPSELYKWPTLVIFDEIHRVGSETWSTVPPKFPSRFRLGVTATPRRKDDAENVFFYSIGPIVFAATEQRMKPKIRRVYTSFKLVASPKFNPNLVSKQLLLRFLCASTKRNELIIEQLIKAVQANRKIIVVSERLKHLDLLETRLKESWIGFKTPPPTTGKYVGGMEEEDQDESKDCQVIFATTQLISEGFDLPALDTLFITTPVSDVEQLCGRILRPHPDKKEPIVVDFRDDEVALCLRAASYREEYYDQLEKTKASNSMPETKKEK